LICTPHSTLQRKAINAGLLPPRLSLLLQNIFAWTFDTHARLPVTFLSADAYFDHVSSAGFTLD
jgi:hypothetical protein